MVSSFEDFPCPLHNSLKASEALSGCHLVSIGFIESANVSNVSTDLLSVFFLSFQIYLLARVLVLFWNEQPECQNANGHADRSSA